MNHKASAFEDWFAASGIPPEHKEIVRAGWTTLVHLPEKKRARSALHLRLCIRWAKKANEQSRAAADFHYRRWDETEEALVMDSKYTVGKLVKILGRTRYAIKTKRKKLYKLNALTPSFPPAPAP